MKFGKSILSQSEGNGDLHYMEYKLLKKRIKDVVACLQASELAEALTANGAFEEELATEIVRVNSSFAKRQTELLDRTASLSEEIHLRQQHWQEGPGSADCSRGKRADRLRCLVDILHEVDQLRKYAVWNAVAVVKILKKRRKQTNFGIEDSAAERAAWLSRQAFFSGSDFAELHASIESLGHMLVHSEIEGAHGSDQFEGALRPLSQMGQEPQQCPICLDTISDMVALSCNHRFCWKCFVLGPIAFQPGEYRITQCPICRRETSEGNALGDAAGRGCNQAASSSSSCGVQANSFGFSPGSMPSPTTEGVLTRFLHTYFPREVLQSSVGASESAKDGLEEEGIHYGVGDSVGDLVKVLLEDCNRLSECRSQGTQPSAGPSDFFSTLPMRPAPDRELGAAQKRQWLQLASTGDPFALDDSTYCSLCSEPLMMEAVVTTPCKHHFHRVCMSRIDMPQCPLCTQNLPFSWFLPADHPCCEFGFRAIPPQHYRPMFVGGPSKGSCGYPLRQPPPAVLHGPEGLRMRSYLHRLIPTGSGLVEDEDEEEEIEASVPEAPWTKLQEAEAEESMSSSEDSGSEESEDDDAAKEDQVATPPRESTRTGGKTFVYSSIGRMRLLRRPQKCSAVEEDSADPRVLNLRDYV
eukprot:TRINITY_DN28056_c0_g1_i1.p1 TRINITY_DN28056_c0_g1~~TRINITY_DN28056_c0_g1_i1.p1  ORF type:complete len:639 (+),score=97.78 TRINITY_DN28056_c0_g1_i1:53-1969(+)